MTFNKLAAATAAITLAALPITAQAADASRASKSAAATSELGDSNQLFLIAALAAIALGIFLIADEDDDEPVSA